MRFIIPSFDSIRTFMVGAYSGRFPDGNLNKFGDVYKRLSVVALGILDNHFYIRQVELDLWPDTAEEEALERHRTVNGVIEKGAVGATRSSALRVFGDVGAIIPTSEPLVHLASGLSYETRSAGVVGVLGYSDVDIGAISVGATSNLEEGEEVQFSTPPLNLEAVARIVLDLTGGLNKETDPDLQSRVLNKIAEGRAGGNRNDWTQWVLESVAYVANSYAYKNRNGGGTVDVVALRAGSGSVRHLTLQERTEVHDYVEALRPLVSTIRVLETTSQEVDVDIAIMPDTDPVFLFDWDDSTPPVVSTYDAGTRLLTFAADRPISMAAGERLIVNDVATKGVEFVIESLSSTNAVVLSEDAGIVAAAQEVYSGGPLVEPARVAIQALFDSLGSANPDSGRYGPWEGNIRRSALFKAVADGGGVLDTQILSPVSTVEAVDPKFPANTTIAVLMSRSIIVRSFASAGLSL